jgi:hypothetical protein
LVDIAAPSLAATPPGALTPAAAGKTGPLHARFWVAVADQLPRKVEPTGARAA